MSAARRPLKSLGQNFLVDRNIIDKIISSAALDSGDSVLEVGPGRGALTEKLVDQTAQLLLVEYDHALAADLAVRHRDNPRVRVVDGDILEVDLQGLLGCDEGTWKVVANLPYNISTQVLFRFLEVRDRLSRMVLMLQKEVGDRLVAPPDCADYGVTTVLLGLWFDMRREFIVSPGCFHPGQRWIPLSSVLCRWLRHGLTLVMRAFSDGVVKGAFAMRRKTLANCLKKADLPVPDGVETVLKVCGIDGQRRGETLSLEEFGRLSRCLSGVIQ